MGGRKELKMSFKRESALYNLFHSDRDYKSQAKKLRDKYPLAKTVLEIGAGTGLLTKELVKQGFVVTIIEPSKEMLANWRCSSVKRYNSKLEDLPANTFKKGQFDLVLALYDVFNYIPVEEYYDAVTKAIDWGKSIEDEIWDKSMGVKFLTFKRRGGWRRLRIGVRWGRIAHLWFIYFGKGIFVEKHKMYL